jgi:hypothetical protein
MVARSTLAASIVALVCCIGASPAAATQIWAGPEPANGPAPCTSTENPCSLRDAVAAAQSGDVVSLLPGDYELYRGPLVVDKPLVQIQGVLVPGDPASKPFLENGVELRGDDDALRDVQVVGQVGAYAPRAVIERVNVLGRGMDACELVANGVLLRDSICNGDGADGVHAEGTNVQLRNVTAVGWMCGVNASGDSGGYTAPDNSVLLVNTIATRIDRSSGLADVCVTNIGHGVTAHAEHSEYGSVDEDESQTVLFTSDNDLRDVPSFFDPLEVNFPDFHETSDASTVGAGMTDPMNGTMDVDGEPRVSACTGKTDIGGDQLPDPACPTTPPPPPTVPPVSNATVVHAQVALLRAVALIAGGTQRVRFTLAHAATVTGVVYAHKARIGRAFQLWAHAGQRKATIPHTIHGHVLQPGHQYRLVMTATSPHAPTVRTTIRFAAR